MLCLFCVALGQLSHAIEIVMQLSIVLFFGVKLTTMDHTRERMLLKHSTSDFDVLAIVTHLKEGVRVGVVAWCFVHVSTIQDQGTKSSDGVLFTNCPVE